MHILHNDFHIIKRFETEQGAKASFTRKWKKKYPNAVIVSQEEFIRTEPTVSVRNLMSGQPVTLRKSEQGTVNDPSMELYWSC